ncbi:tetratricopeptide repeat protein [Alteromonas sp. CYL-A6]|uniref:tetratricopeptide repeat protein n=1 Tax=Alteromonas nitratireducens TaxID=3390813 RepID=UPI0034B8F94C
MQNITDKSRPFISYLSVLLLLIVSGCSSVPAPAPDSTAAALPSEQPGAEAGQGSAYHLAHNAYQMSKLPFSEKQQAAFREALATFEQGEAAEAERILMQLTSDSELPSAVWVLRGDIAASQGEHSRAETHYQAALEKNPNNYFALNRLGTYARERGEFGQAKALYLRAINAWMGFAPAHYNLGILYDLYTGNKADALNEYRVFLTLAEADGKPQRMKQVTRWVTDLERQLAADERGTQ